MVYPSLYQHRKKDWLLLTNLTICQPNKEVNWGKLKIMKKRNLFRYRHTNCSKLQARLWSWGRLLFMGRNHVKRGELSYSFFKSKTMETSFENSLSRQNQSRQSSIPFMLWYQTKLGHLLFMSLKKPYSWYEVTPNQLQLFKKIPILCFL